MAIGLGSLEDGHDIAFNCQAPKDRGFLRQIAKAENGAAVHRKSGDVFAIEKNSTAVGLHQSHYRIKAGGLPGSVWTK